MADVSLTAGIRSNLVSLSQTNKLMDQTTERLASGKKVASAVDNPSNFFAAANYNDRADGLESRLDGMGQAIQQIQAADNGISSLRGFLSQMKGVVNDALSEASSTSRQDLGKQFNELLFQASETVKDSGYGGVNLLNNQESITVQFNELNGESELDVQGFNVGAQTGGAHTGTGELKAASHIEADGTATKGVAANGLTSSGEYALILNTSDSTGSGVFGIQSHGTNDVGAGKHEINWGNTASGTDGLQFKEDLNTVIEQIEGMDEELKTQASKLANNLAVISQREDFTNEHINILKEGADKLTLADLNEEGANLLALQTQSQLGIQSLSLASQQSQNVLRIIG